jgi:hypothetical protein
LEFSPTNTEIAKTIGSTRWQVAHFMRHFQQLGWLERRPDLWVHCETLGSIAKPSGRFSRRLPPARSRPSERSGLQSAFLRRTYIAFCFMQQ